MLYLGYSKRAAVPLDDSGDQEEIAWVLFARIRVLYVPAFLRGSVLLVHGN